MPNTDDIQPAIDDLGAQLEAEFAARNETDAGEPAGDDANPVDASAESAAGEEASPPPTPAAEPPSEPGGFTVDVGGQQVTIDDEYARRLLGLQGWAQALPDDVREQFGGIEAGSHVAVSKADMEAFRRWQAQNGGSGKGEFDVDDLDPDTAEYVRGVQAERDELRRSQQDQLVARQRSGLQDLSATIDTVAGRFAERHGLTALEMEAVQAEAAALQIVPRLVNAGRTVGPTGRILAEANYEDVFDRAFEAGMAAHPQLRLKLVEAEVAQRLAAERTANETVDGKRARASSLASVPSAALPRDQNTPRLSPQDMTAAVAAEVRRSMNGGGEN